MGRKRRTTRKWCARSAGTFAQECSGRSIGCFNDGGRSFSDRCSSKYVGEMILVKASALVAAPDASGAFGRALLRYAIGYSIGQRLHRWPRVAGHLALAT